MHPSQQRSIHPAPSSTPLTGSIYRGRISNVTEYGVFVRFGRFSGLAHKSTFAPFLKRDHLVKGANVVIRITKVRPDKKIDVELFEVAPPSSNGVHPTPANLKRKQLPPSGDHTLSDALDGAFIAASGNYNQHVGGVIRDSADLINKIGQQFAKNTPESRAGYVTEAAHAGSFNTDVAFKGGKSQAEMLASNGSKSPDIVLTDGKTGAMTEFQSKVYKDANSSSKAQRGYGSQKRVVPSDQLKDVKKHSSMNVAKEQAKSNPNRRAVEQEYREVNQNATDRVSNQDGSSKPMSRRESQEMGNKAKAGAVKGSDLSGNLRARAWDGAKAGAKAGALAGAGVAAAVGGYKAVKDYKDGKRTGEEALGDFAVHAGKGALDGGIKGAAAGAAGAAGRVLAERASSQVAKKILGGSAPAAIAITGVELAKHAIDLARGKSSAEEFKKASVETTINGVVSYAGAEIGFLLGGPIGAVVGGIAAPLLVSAAEETGLADRIRRLFADDTDTGHNRATIFHMAQREKLLEALTQSSAVIFLDRVIRLDNGHQHTCELILVHESNVYMVDFRAWKGSISFPPLMRETIKKSSFLFFFETEEKVMVPTGELDDKSICQTKVDQYNIAHKKIHRNPAKGVGGFVYHARARLVAGNPKWDKFKIHPRVVFPDDAKFDEVVAADGRFIKFSELLDLLKDTKRRPTPSWMLNDLFMLPMWDVIEGKSGHVYEGLIKTESIVIKVEDEKLTVPMDAILKVDIKGASTLSRGDDVDVMLRNLQVIKGTVDHTSIMLERKGHCREFNLCDLRSFCPASSAI